MRYLLDTDTCVAAVRRLPAVEARLRALSPDDLAISAVSLAEIRYGIARSHSRKRYETLWRSFVSVLDVIDFDGEAAAAYGEVRAHLEGRGRMIGDHDCMIAATALSRGLAVVTHNVREFRRVAKLAVEDWIA